MSDTNDDLKKSGVEIIDGDETSSGDVSSDSADRLKRAFDAEMATQTSQASSHPSGDLGASLQHLKETKQKIAMEAKALEEETANEIEALKKTKAIIEGKIAHLKKLEQTGTEVDSKIKKIETLESEKKEIEEDIKNFDKTVAGQ